MPLFVWRHSKFPLLPQLGSHGVGYAGTLVALAVVVVDDDDEEEDALHYCLHMPNDITTCGWLTVVVIVGSMQSELNLITRLGSVRWLVLSLFNHHMHDSKESFEQRLCCLGKTNIHLYY